MTYMFWALLGWFWNLNTGTPIQQRAKAFDISPVPKLPAGDGFWKRKRTAAAQDYLSSFVNVDEAIELFIRLSVFLHVSTMIRDIFPK